LPAPQAAPHDHAAGAAPLAHHFENLEQQHEASTLGMWAFLATEVLFFGAVFTGYAIYRSYYTEAFVGGSKLLKLWLGTVNTAVLISSSLTVVLALHGARTGRRRLLVLFLAATMVLGAVFLGIKATEYYIEYEEHLVPGLDFAPREWPEGVETRHGELFFTFYFIMTGLHAVHMLVGMGVLLVVFVFACRGHYSARYHTPVELFGLYWHFVDIIWIFLFPLLYLVR
jgi:cytochrome c oxidase subunit 3